MEKRIMLFSCRNRPHRPHQRSLLRRFNQHAATISGAGLGGASNGSDTAGCTLSQSIMLVPTLGERGAAGTLVDMRSGLASAAVL